MAKTPKQQLYLDLHEFQSRFMNLAHRVKGDASYRPISRPELDLILGELAEDVDFCFKRFIETPHSNTSTEVDHSAAYEAVDKAEAKQVTTES